MPGHGGRDQRQTKGKEMTIYKIVNAGQSIRRDARKRMWMFMGVPAIVAPETTLKLMADRVDEKYYITFELRGAANTPLIEAALPLKAWTNLTEMCALYILPRAVRYDASLRPVAMLMEFVSPGEAFATLAGVKQ